MFDWGITSKIKKEECDTNILKSNEIYYHKNLLIRNGPNVVSQDLDSGEITNSETEFYLEPRASYTIKDVVDYFYEKTEADEKVYYRKRLYGYFKTFIKQHGLDTTLFIIEALGRQHEYTKTDITLEVILNYLPTAKEYLDEAMSNRKQLGKPYVLKQRKMLSYRSGI